MDDIPPYFQPPRYPIDGKSNSDTCLTPTVSLDSDPSEPSYQSYDVESDPSEPSHPLVIRLASDSSSSYATPHHTPPPVRGRGRAQEGGHGDDTPNGFGNGYLSFDWWTWSGHV